MKTLRLMLAVLLATIVGGARAESISVADTELTPGSQAAIIINCDFTSADITAYQFDLYLPEGVTLAKNDKGRYAAGATYVLGDRHDEHTASLKANDGFVRFVVSQNDKYTLNPGSGELLRVIVDVADTYSGGANGEVKNFIMSEVNQTKHYMSDITFALTVAPAEEPQNQPDVTGKTFTLSCARGYVGFNGTRLIGTTQDDASEFTIVDYDGTNYLFDVTNSAIVIYSIADLTDTQNILLESATNRYKAVTGLKWGKTGFDNYPWYLEDGFGNWLNMNGANNVILNTWKDFENAEGGNTYQVEIVNADFDATEAIQIISAASTTPEEPEEPEDTPDVTRKTFTLNCARGYVGLDGSQVHGTTQENASEFAIIEYDGTSYLFDVTHSAFVVHTTAAKAGTTGNNSLESTTDISNAVTGLTWGKTGFDSYPWYLEDSFGNWLNMDNNQNVYFNTWKDFESAGGGNTYKVEIVNADFDATGALQLISSILNPETSVSIDDTFTASVPCGEGTADLTFKVTNIAPLEVEVSASPEDISGELTIPATVEYDGTQFAVRRIGESAFRGRSLTSVVLPTGIREIGDNAFRDCAELTTINLPEGIKQLGFWAFCDSGLSSVALPEGITDFYSAVFAGCRNLSSVAWPSDLTAISPWTFRQCTSLTSFDIPNTVTSIGEHAFRESGLESITFPSTLTDVAEQAFVDCKSLRSIDFNRCAAYFAYDCFYGCSSLEELYIPNTVKFKNGDDTWSWNTFANCTSLKTVVFEAFEEGQERWSTTSVFPDCTALETIVLPSTSVMQKSFFLNCTSLRSVTYLEIADDFDPRQHNFAKMYEGLDANQIHFTVPEGKAELLLKAGYMHISDLSGLPVVKAEFEAEATRIATMAETLVDGDKTALATAIDEARTAVDAAEDYAAVYAQIAAVKTAAKTFLATATIAKGTDVTAAFVVNPDFDNSQFGWNGKIDWPSYPPHVFLEGWNEAAYENGDVTISKFIDAVDIEEGRTLGDGTTGQTITTLPMGIYRLEADIIATNQHNAEAEVTGISLFAGNDAIPVATTNGVPEHFCLTFENKMARDVAIGINIAGTNANWVAIDNVRLYYEGKATAIPQGTDLVSDENARVYLYNVEAAKFLNAGHSWGTHAIINTTGLPLRLTKDAETGMWQIYFWEGSKNLQLLFNEWGEAYVDYQEQESKDPWWFITQAADGSLLIQSRTGGEGEYLGNDMTKQDAQVGEYTGVTYSDVYTNATTKDNIHWVVMTEEQYNEYINPTEHDTDIAALSNAIYIEAAEGQMGTTIELPVKMKNALTPVGCSFRITLPAGFLLAMDEDGDIISTVSDRAKKTSLSYKNWGDGTYDFALMPTSGTATISGEDGEILTLRLKLPNGVEPGAYKIRLTTNLLQSKGEGKTQDFELDDVLTTVTLTEGEFILGDVNGDGKVTPSDAIMILYDYFGVEQTGFNAAAADLNDDGKISPADAIEALYTYFGSSKQNTQLRLEPMREPE